MKIVFFHRKPRPGNFSMENLFEQIREALPPDITWKVKELSYLSNGLFKRLYITLEAFFFQGDINHITGDIHFIAAFLSKKRTVLTIHDLGLLHQPNLFIRSILKLFWLTIPIRKSSIITTVSEATKSELLRSIKISPSKVRVVYNPISPSFVSNPKTFKKEEPVILQIGTKYNKNISRLIQALQGISCQLQIVGHLDDLVTQELKCSGIKFHSRMNLSKEEILELYHEADIISLVSTFEGFGIPIIEGNAIGRVVVTSNISSMPEVAGNAAHLINPFDVLSIRNGFLKVIEDDEYREGLIANGYTNQNRFNAKMIAWQYAEIYKSLYY